MASYQPLSNPHLYYPRLDPSDEQYQLASSDRPGSDRYDPAIRPQRGNPQPSGGDDEYYQTASHSALPAVDGYDNYIHNEVQKSESTELITGVPLAHHRLYKRRWIGLIELTVLNFAIGWGYAASGVVSTTATKWYDITFQELNSLSIAGSLVFLVPAPFVIWVLNRWGPKYSILIACFFTVLGNWIIFAGARTHNFSVNVVGTIIHSLASPFVQAAPTRYSRQWFPDNARTFATALPSLAYPLGSGIGALTGPNMLKPIGTLEYDDQALIIAVIFTTASIPAPFIPRGPPSPPSFVAAAKKLGICDSLKSLARNPTFYLQIFCFSVLVGAIDALTAVTNQGLEPYGYPQTDAGYAVAFFLFVGIAAALVISPIIDRTKSHLLAIRIIFPIVAIAYTILPFIPQTRSVAALYFIFAVIGITNLSIEPCLLEFQAAWTHPVSPEFSSVICWSGTKILGAVLTLIVGNELVLTKPAEGQPVGSLFNGLIFIAGMAWLCVPCAWLNGYWIFKRPVKSIVEGNF